MSNILNEVGSLEGASTAHRKNLDGDQHGCCVYTNKSKLLATGLITSSCFLRRAQSWTEDRSQLVEECGLPCRPLGSSCYSWNLCDIHRESNADVNSALNLHCSLHKSNGCWSTCRLELHRIEAA